MPSFDILKSSVMRDTFRTSAIKSIYNINEDKKLVERFTGHLPIEGKDWNIGVIYGHSGTGKSTISREVFDKDFIEGFIYDNSKSIIDNFGSHISINEISRVLLAVGMSSVPSWLKPYNILSTGEKMRIDLARAILSGRKRIVFDEFTSVVDRQIAKVGSYAIQKAIRRLKKQFVAVSCHDDILEWLEPDWVFNTNTMRFFRAGATRGPESIWRSCLGNVVTGEPLVVITI